MFQELYKIMGKATISLTIKVTGSNELTVGITPKSEGSEMVPAILVGSPEELDKEFASSISGLVQDAEVMVLKSAAQKASTEGKKDSAKKPAATTQQSFAGKVAEKVEKAEEIKKAAAVPTAPVSPGMQKLVDKADARRAATLDLPQEISEVEPETEVQPEPVLAQGQFFDLF